MNLLCDLILLVIFALVILINYLRGFVKSIWGLITCVACFGATQLPKKAFSALEKRPFGPALSLFLMLSALLLSTAYLVDGSFNPFLYFRF